MMNERPSKNHDFTAISFMYDYLRLIGKMISISYDYIFP